jgi:hypothetical protein
MAATNILNPVESRYGSLGVAFRAGILGAAVMAGIVATFN